MEQLWRVSIRHKETGETLNLEVWADSNEHATFKLLNSVIGIDKRYAWTGTGPVYKDNQVVTRG
jgi:uncharacterized protein YydD (DUF2326 family)